MQPFEQQIMSPEIFQKMDKSGIIVVPVFVLSNSHLEKPADAIRFVVASSCLCLSINGNFNSTARSEVGALIGESTSGFINR